MGKCRSCGDEAITISAVMGFCAACIRSRFAEIRPAIQEVHRRSRRNFGLPEEPPRSSGGIPCHLCFQECRIPEGKTGYCGLRRVEDGVIRGGRPHDGNLSFYHDPLPTNCVGDFVCPAGTGSGYPRYAHTRGPEYGYKNLAVFYQACSFNCLYCQNYHFRAETRSSTTVAAAKLAGAADPETSCICYFGGDPSPQVLHAVKASKLARGRAGSRILRICWETNGATREPFLSMMAQVSLDSGGCIKVDLKAWDEGLHHALCGVSNRHTLGAFETLSKWIGRRPDPPFLIASTLLVPGYVDEEEVARLSTFIARLDRDIPYRLLAFHPCFHLKDLPTTSRDHALRCRAAAERAGLRRVAIGNIHLLGDAYRA